MPNLLPQCLVNWIVPASSPLRDRAARAREAGGQEHVGEQARRRVALEVQPTTEGIAERGDGDRLRFGNIQSCNLNYYFRTAPQCF